MLWEREAYNLYKAGKTISQIKVILMKSRGVEYEDEEIFYAIELAAQGPIDRSEERE